MLIKKYFSALRKFVETRTLSGKEYDYVILVEVSIVSITTSQKMKYRTEVYP